MERKISKEKIKKIVVAGDVTIDWMEVTSPPDETDGTYNWQKYSGTRQFARPGGALLLADFIRSATQTTVAAQELTDLENISPEEVLHSVACLAKFPYSTSKQDEKNFVYRLSEFKGFSGPEKGDSILIPVKDDDTKTDIVVIDDAGNGFRANEKLWPAALTKGIPPVVITMMSHPIEQSPLMKLLQKKHSASLIIVVSADSLRKEGVKISRRLSWERTAKDFAWQMACNPNLVSLNNCNYLIVRFGVDGAILYKRRRGIVESRLFYDPKVEEDGFADIHPGMMQGLSSAFVAALTATLYREGLESIEKGVRHGILSSRHLWQFGFGKDSAKLDYPKHEIFDLSGKEVSSVTDITVPNPSQSATADPDFWCIMNELTKTGLENVANNYVISGVDPVLDRVPLGQFGNLMTIDRSEIESYRSIKNLIREYLSSSGAANPLSIAVFGKPGSGKSFGVTEVAESVAPGKIEKLEFNLSQFESTSDLIAAFHRVRDKVLEGKVPIVFFDEFDSGFNGHLGWLKYFLSPMQDGKFRDGEAVHPVGRVIFVFAGGTCSTFQEFSKEDASLIKKTECKSTSKTEVFGEDDLKAFKDVKGPDFVSRLRGFVNIKGPDPADDNDKLYMLRRALLLRFLLTKNAKHLVNGQKKLAIDQGVLRAMLKIRKYKHGVRSMAAIIDMSLLAGRKSFEQAALPSLEQLELHVDAEMFYRLVMSDVLLGSERENLAKVIHELYLKDQKKKKIKNKPSLVPWGKLSENLKESNRQQADNIPLKLKAIGCGFTPVLKDQKQRLASFTKEEIEVMSKMEHERWTQEKFLAGGSYGKTRNDKKKIHPNLVEWERLPEKIKDYDRNAVRTIPEILAKAGFEIYRL